MITIDSERQTFQSSELSRSAPVVFAAAERHPVEVTRRDGESLVLMSATEAKARQKLLEIAAQLIVVDVSDDTDPAERLVDRFPWMYALSAEDRKKCAADMIRSARAAFTTGQAHLAVAAMHAWKETAAAIAAGLGSEPIEWLDEDSPAVERP